MKNRIQSCSPHPTTNAALLAAIQEEWDVITNGEIAAMVDSMPARIQEVYNVAGGHTRY